MEISLEKQIIFIFVKNLEKILREISKFSKFFLMEGCQKAMIYGKLSVLRLTTLCGLRSSVARSIAS